MAQSWQLSLEFKIQPELPHLSFLISGIALHCGTLLRVTLPTSCKQKSGTKIIGMDAILEAWKC